MQHFVFQRATRRAAALISLFLATVFVFPEAVLAQTVSESPTCRTPAVLARIADLKKRIDRYRHRIKLAEEEIRRLEKKQDFTGWQVGNIFQFNRTLDDLIAQLEALEALPPCEKSNLPLYPGFVPLPGGLGVISSGQRFFFPNSFFFDGGLGDRKLNSNMTNVSLASAIPFPNTPDSISLPGSTKLNSAGLYGEIGAGLHLWHAPTSLFVSNGSNAQLFIDAKAFFGLGDNSKTVHGIAGTFPSIVSSANAQNDSMTSKSTWDAGVVLQGGISQNWFRIGATSIFGQYGFGGAHFKDNITCSSGVGACGSNGLPGWSETNDITRTGQIWGVGLIQSLNGAAVDIYIDYKHFALGSTTSIFGNSATSVGVTANFRHDLDVVIAGARIRF